MVWVKGGRKVKKWSVIILITIAVLGVTANSFLYVRQTELIRDDQALILSLQTDLADTKGQAASLSETLQSLSTNVSSLSTLVGNLQNDVASTKDGMSSLSGDIQTMSTDVSTLSSSVDILRQNQSAGGAGSIANFTSATNKVKPCVVVIEVQVVTTFFGRKVTQQGTGSGWIINSDGIIVTNSHVVADATSIKITLADGRSFPAISVQIDPVSDLAVVKIDARNLPAATVGDSDKLQTGQPVAAIGNALGLGINMTGGWISRLNTSITFSDGSKLSGLIGTDAAINPGNSGGPLIDINGEVVGITNAKLVQTGVEGIGYAISINNALKTINNLITKL